MKIDFNKSENGLVPAIIQDNETKNVLMLGYMNEEAFLKTKEIGKATFYSRSKKRLWTKGESSGNFLNVVSMTVDCDNDTLLVYVNPEGPACHKGTGTCWNQSNTQSYGFLTKLEDTIDDRIENADVSNSYVASLFKKGINKIAQKVGEEAVELVIEAKDTNDILFLEESADLLFHYLLLLKAKGYSLNHAVEVLKARDK